MLQLTSTGLIDFSTIDRGSWLKDGSCDQLRYATVLTASPLRNNHAAPTLAVSSPHLKSIRCPDTWELENAATVSSRISVTPEFCFSNSAASSRDFPERSLPIKMEAGGSSFPRDTHALSHLSLPLLSFSSGDPMSVSYTHLTLPTTPYV